MIAETFAPLVALVQWAKKPFVKPEFEVAKRMVGLLYFQVRDLESMVL